jgi:transposase-like protein
MKKTTNTPVKTQAEMPSTAKELREYIHAMVRKALMGVIQSEITELCGTSWYPQEGSLYNRAGSAPSSVYMQGKQEALDRPRVREKTATGSKEVHLKAWELAQDPEEWEAAMMRAVLCGVSTRKMGLLRDCEVQGESKSNLSRLWQRKAAELVMELQEADLSGFDLLVLMVDAVVLAEGLTVTVALGIDTQGEKRILGYRVGASENEEVCMDLLKGLRSRGLKESETRTLLAVLDGSKALKNAVHKSFRRVLVQRCLVHKERNIRGYLSKRDWKALSGHFNRLRKAQGTAAALEACAALEGFLATRNAQARESYAETGEELLVLHRLAVPNTLNVSLLSTNSIENAFKNLRRHIGRVCRWRKNSDQADLWVASGLLLAQKGFRRIKGHKDIEALVKALELYGKEEKAA